LGEVFFDQFHCVLTGSACGCASVLEQSSPNVQWRCNVAVRAERSRETGPGVRQGQGFLFLFSFSFSGAGYGFFYLGWVGMGSDGGGGG
jgi:hypothetical protein